MKTFLGKNFLLPNQPAERLYHEYAANQPIIDYHNHLIPEQVATDARFETIADVWLGGDHYKWRQMRSNGVPEAEITGRAPDWNTFLAWAKTIPSTIGNPLYHWTHLELRRYFGIEDILNEQSAKKIWTVCNERLKQPDFSVIGLLKKMNVKAICTTDDPADSLEHHIAYAKTNPVKKANPLMFPAFRPDKALAVENSKIWADYLKDLGQSANLEITNFRTMIDALGARHQFFHDHGCRLTDHALVVPPGKFLTDREAEKVFQKAFGGAALAPDEVESLKGSLLKQVGAMNYQRGWTMQLHIGAMRNLNSNMLAKLGPDTGYDAISDLPIGTNLALLLDAMQKVDQLPRTVIYTLNPAMNDVVATIMGAFQDGSVAGKIQFGSAWWYNDQLDGMRKQMTSLGNLGLLPRFVGMLTDSRSFLSFPRHEYFRRLLCNILGTWMNEGEVPGDFDLMGNIVRDICFRNAQQYFKLPGV